MACYEHHGDGLLSVCARITDLPRQGAEALPPEDAERIGREQAANDKRMRMLMNQIDALDPADRSYERKFSDLQRRLDDLYDRDADFQEALEETGLK